MRTATTILLAASVAFALACSDGSPTSPEKSAQAVSPAAADAPVVTMPARGRRTVVVAPRGELAPPGVWGSSQASLTISDAWARLEVLSLNLPTGACYGTFDAIGARVPNGRFSLSGTHTQLVGFFPGHVEYPASYSGAVDGDRLTITATVPATQQTFGPYVLTRGVSNAWTPCVYP
jgi:hypothetical protein